MRGDDEDVIFLISDCSERICSISAEHLNLNGQCRKTLGGKETVGDDDGMTRTAMSATRGEGRLP